jgi:RNA polymerase sigma-70 factor (ECF subfamily)
MEDAIRRHLDEKRYREAFELLVAAYQHKVFRLAVAMLGDPALAEEAAQEALLRVWKSLAGYRGQALLSTWIYAIARNVCLSAARTIGAARALPLEQAGVQEAAESRRATEWSRREGADVMALVAQLPEKHRQAVVLYYMEEKSYEEVSLLLGLPMGTVKTYLHRARKQLAEAAVRSGFGMGVR